MRSGRAVLDMSFLPEASAPRKARAAVATHFGDHPRSGDLLVCVSEAVTNAVLHAGTAVRLVVRENGRRLRFEVTDDDPTVPSARTPEPTSPTGRGLLLIDRLTASWGVDLRGNGKTVWFEVVA